MRDRIDQAWQQAREQYAELGIDADAALSRLENVSLSVHCWQGDDVGGFESGEGLSGGGIMATGDYPGRARTPDELRGDIEFMFSLLPGSHRLSLHAIYAETGGGVDRDELAPEHFRNWIDWAREQGLGLDFNQTFFSHPKADDGFTLSHRDPAIRDFWIAHGQACRRIAAAMGEALDTPCITNLWIPDGYKDIPVDREGPRARLAAALDAVFAETFDAAVQRDSVESKLFGIGSESYVVGSHEFYLGYAVSRGKVLCLDTGHFHPTEVVSDKLSAVLQFVPEVLLHVSRGVRWDSDHVVILSDELRELARELVRHDYLARVHIGLDFFDASINRIAAWQIGCRAVLQALLQALLEPTERLAAAEKAGDHTARLALLEAGCALPWGAVWNHYCQQRDVPPGAAWLDRVRAYERDVLNRRAQ